MVGHAMSDRGVEFPPVGWRASTVWVILGVLLSALLVAPVFGESGQAATTVGYVLAEALVLYVGYGVLMRIAGPAAREILVST